MAQGPDPTNASQCNQSSATALTTSQVLANNLTFTQITVPGGHASVSISLQITYNSSNPAFAISKTLQSAIGRVSAATFDDNLLPNADNTFDIGQIAPNLRWRNGNFAGTVTIGTAGGALGIGTETPSGVLDVVASSTNALIVASNGNVGIGTTNPSSNLEIDGIQNASSSYDQLDLYNPTNATGSVAGITMHTGGGWWVNLRTNQNNTWLELTGGNASSSEGAVQSWAGNNYYPGGDLNGAYITGGAASPNDGTVSVLGGNFGVGIVNPGDPLSVLSSSNHQIASFSGPSGINDGYIVVNQGDYGGNAILGSTAGVGFVGSQTSTPFTIRVNNGAVAYFGTNGYVGIGTQSPGATLEVNGNALIDNNLSVKLGYIGIDTSSYIGDYVPSVPLTNTSTATTYPTGFYSTLLYGSSGYPSTFGYLLNLSETGNRNSVAQLYNSWTGYGTQGGAQGEDTYWWARSNRDSNNQFGSWQQIVLLQQNGNLDLGTYNSVNYGSGNIYTSGSGTATAWNTSSDIRLKKDIQPIHNALQIIESLHGVTFKWKADNQPSIGFIAQQVQQVLPQIVTTDSIGYEALDYSKITPILVEAVKQQQTEINNQQNEINSLKSLVCQNNSTSSYCAQ
jgi:hypothetical protein